MSGIPFFQIGEKGYLINLVNRLEFNAPLGTFYTSNEYKNKLHEELIILAQRMNTGDWQMYYDMPVYIRRRHIKYFNRQIQEQEEARAVQRGELGEAMSKQDVQKLQNKQKEDIITKPKNLKVKAEDKKETNTFNIPKFSMNSRK